MEKKLQHYLPVLGVAVNIHDITYPCPGLTERIGSVGICVLLLLLQCILSIFPASVHQFYANILVFVINPFLYINPICIGRYSNAFWYSVSRSLCLVDMGFWIGYADFGNTQILHTFAHSTVVCQSTDPAPLIISKNFEFRVLWS